MRKTTIFLLLIFFFTAVFYYLQTKADAQVCMQIPSFVYRYKDCGNASACVVSCPQAYPYALSGGCTTGSNTASHVLSKHYVSKGTSSYGSDEWKCNYFTSGAGTWPDAWVMCTDVEIPLVP